MMDGNHIDEQLARVIREYHEPPDVSIPPGEWPAIADSLGRKSTSSKGSSHRWAIAASFLGGLLVGAAALALVSGSGPSEATEWGEPKGAFEVLVQDHLAQTATLLTAFGADGNTRQFTASQSVAARDLLLATRTARSALASEEGELPLLLADIELVLAQIALIGSNAPIDEIRVIQESLVELAVVRRIGMQLPRPGRTL